MPDERRRGAPAAHDVTMSLEIILRGADVEPVFAIHVGDKCFSLLDQGREIPVLDRVLRVRGNTVKGVRFQDVNPRVDRVASNLIRARFLQESAHVPVRVNFHKPVSSRVVDWGQDDGGPGLPGSMQVEEGRQVDLGEHITVEHDNGAVKVRLGEFDRAACAPRGWAQRGSGS